MYAMIMMALLTFLMSLIVGLGGPASNENVEADAVAMQMSAWHMAAQKKCLVDRCADNGSGTVRPTSDYFSEMLKDADFVRLQRFSSFYDSPTRYVVTYLTGRDIQRADLNPGRISGRISASFQERLKGESSSHIGYWKKSENKAIFPSKTRGIEQLEIPVSVSNNIADNSPVIISHYE